MTEYTPLIESTPDGLPITFLPDGGELIISDRTVVIGRPRIGRDAAVVDLRTVKEPPLDFERVDPPVRT
jgi:hypothetical protein